MVGVRAICRENTDLVLLGASQQASDLGSKGSRLEYADNNIADKHLLGTCCKFRS